MPSPSFEPNWDKKVFAWVLVDRLTGRINEVEFADTPPSFPHEDDDTNRFVYEGYLNGGDSILLYGDGMKPMPQPNPRIRNVRTAIWNNEA
jgi:hypothetical protein